MVLRQNTKGLASNGGINVMTASFYWDSSTQAQVIYDRCAIREDLSSAIHKTTSQIRNYPSVPEPEMTNSGFRAASVTPVGSAFSSHLTLLGKGEHGVPGMCHEEWSTAGLEKEPADSSGSAVGCFQTSEEGSYRAESVQLKNETSTSQEWVETNWATLWSECLCRWCEGWGVRKGNILFF